MDWSDENVAGWYFVESPNEEQSATFDMTM